jgi:hypothetical protein
MGQFLPLEHGRLAGNVSAVCLACPIRRAVNVHEWSCGRCGDRNLLRGTALPCEPQSEPQTRGVRPVARSEWVRGQRVYCGRPSLAASTRCGSQPTTPKLPRSNKSCGAASACLLKPRQLDSPVNWPLVFKVDDPHSKAQTTSGLIWVSLSGSISEPGLEARKARVILNLTDCHYAFS